MPHMPNARRAAAGLVVGALVLIGAGCADDRVTLDPDPDKPFVLTGVADVTEIAQLTGPGAMNDTASVGIAGTDLGSMLNLGERTYFLFGDTFGERPPDAIGGQGGFWRSNALAWTTDDDPSDGISFDGWLTDEVGLAKAMIEGQHDSNEIGGEVTKIPTYGFAVGGSLYVAYMSVARWGEPGAWDANYAALVKSDDGGDTWQRVEHVRWPGESNFVQFAAAEVSDSDADHIYIWGIPAGRFGGVQLMRVKAEENAVESQAGYEYFAGVDGDAPQWSTEMSHARTVLEGTIGELSVMWSPYLERWIMTYSDGGNAYLREGITPWGPWGEPIELVAAEDYPGLYSPYLNPRYVSEGGRRIHFTLSLWDPYNIFWFSADLHRKGAP